MSDMKAFIKLYQVKEKELDQVQKQYNRAVDHFENEATSLYDLLKERENLEQNLSQQVTQGIKVGSIADFYNYFESVKSKELNQQKKVHQARVNMYKKQEQLQEEHGELKKIDKIIENKKEQQKRLNQQLEASFLDEIAVQQYSRVR
ncbi:flagellar export protein FliJ [Alkalibacillus silvisoli]|uniref:Flagellar FliJ protein n=1 Tax=Alkalibacillus silvisoli TaxID=392823 RepID=A0ABN0ZWH0_9BACI